MQGHPQAEARIGQTLSQQLMPIAGQCRTRRPGWPEGASRATSLCLPGHGAIFCPMLMKLGTRTTFHMLRHDMASRMKALGQFNFKDIQEQLGHSNIQITMDIYNHIDEEAKAAVSHWLDGDAGNIVSLASANKKRQVR
ncbi:Phage integrase family protein [Selenomonas ruminantium]|uniref:Phage integrase family protein n=2 Tax=Selenomonas ruminantium TaxID=971 RepID=A0A1H0VMM8_SELRU|nr:Phage integrase family protein [Selenomonas ruminantium]